MNKNRKRTREKQKAETTNPITRCPVCGLKFEREQGYFIGALYVSYLLGIPIVGALMLVYWWLTPWRLETLLLAAFLTFQLFVPVVLRFAKVVWMYADRAFDPEK